MQAGRVGRFEQLQRLRVELRVGGALAAVHRVIERGTVAEVRPLGQQRVASEPGRERRAPLAEIAVPRRLVAQVLAREATEVAGTDHRGDGREGRRQRALGGGLDVAAVGSEAARDPRGRTRDATVCAERGQRRRRVGQCEWRRAMPVGEAPRPKAMAGGHRAGIIDGQCRMSADRQSPNRSSRKR